MNSLIDKPFDYTGLRKEIIESEADPEGYREKHPGIAVKGIGAKGIYFAGTMEILGFIAQNVDWTKKARIVLEYDPDANGMEIAAICEQDERSQETD